MFELSRKAVILRADGPAVWFDVGIGGADVDHRFDCEATAGNDNASLCWFMWIMWHARLLMKLSADAMPLVRSHDTVAASFRVPGYRFGNIVNCTVGACSSNANVQGIKGYLC